MDPDRMTPIDTPQQILVFVYGTLLRGESNADLLAEAHYRGHAHTSPGFELVDLGAYPAMIPGGNSSVMGELYAVDSRTLATLDRLEGHPEYYRRIEVVLSDGTPAQTYVMSPDRVVGCPRIESGDWLSDIA